MKAVILVGGEATRLRPLTLNTPKAMVPVLNRPFLEHVLCHLKGHGVDTVVLALGHLHRWVADYFGDGSRFGVRLVYSVEDHPLGTAGPVKLAGPYIDGRFLVLNGDVFADFDIGAMLQSHIRNGAKATIALTPVEDPSAFGVVETGPDGRVQRFIEKPGPGQTSSNMINAGVYVLEQDVLDLIPPGEKYMFENGVFPGLLSSNAAVFGYGIKGYWIDIGTPEKYLKLNLDLVSGKGLQSCIEAAGGMAAGPGEGLDPNARVDGKVLIGERCAIGPGARIAGPAVLGPGSTIGKDAAVASSVLWEGVVVGEGSSVANSVIGRRARLGKGVRAVDGCMLSDDVVVADGAQLPPGLRLAPGTKYGY